MDGTLAAIFLIASLSDMTLNDCETGCLSRTDDQARLSFQLAKVEFDRDIIGNEAYIGFDMARRYGPFQPTFGASVTDAGDVWIGAGAKYRFEPFDDTGIYLEGSLLPGLHFANDGPDIGGVFHFRSALGLGYEFDNGASVFASYDHRSNADTLPLNPGLETISIRFSVPLN